MDVNSGVLLELAARCEKEEPSEALNEAIADAVGMMDAPFGHSLDAAVTLVPEGAVLHLYDVGEHCKHAIIGLDCREHQADWCAGLALALCAASLRARAAAMSTSPSPSPGV